jgi:DNA processing protein
VVEARRNSGALITARLAAEMGKEVYAVPGGVNDPRSRGCHALLKDGAKLVESIEDIVSELGPLAESVDLGETQDEYVPAANLEGLTDAQRKVYAALDDAPKTVDEVSASSGVGTPAALAALLILEMAALVKQLPGKRFVRRMARTGGSSKPD